MASTSNGPNNTATAKGHGSTSTSTSAEENDAGGGGDKNSTTAARITRTTTGTRLGEAPSRKTSIVFSPLPPQHAAATAAAAAPASSSSSSEMARQRRHSREPRHDDSRMSNNKHASAGGEEYKDGDDESEVEEEGEEEEGQSLSPGSSMQRRQSGVPRRRGCGGTQRHDSGAAAKGGGEGRGGVERWWRSFSARYGSVELDNKGSVARDHLALERTFLAWLRTSLAFASIGIAVIQLFRLNTAFTGREHDGDHGAIRLRQLGKPIGVTFLGISIIVLFVGFHRYFESQHWIIRGKFPASRLSIFVVTVIAGALIVGSLIVLLVVDPGGLRAQERVLVVGQRFGDKGPESSR